MLEELHELSVEEESNLLFVFSPPLDSVELSSKILPSLTGESASAEGLDITLSSSVMTWSYLLGSVLGEALQLLLLSPLSVSFLPLSFSTRQRREEVYKKSIKENVYIIYRTGKNNLATITNYADCD